MTSYSFTTDDIGRVSVRSETDGVVHREIIEPGQFVGADQWQATNVADRPEEVSSYCQEAWTDDVVAAYKATFPWVEPEPAPPPVLLPYQFRAMLALSGKQAALDAYIAALPDPQKTIAQAKLDYSLTFRRDNDLVLAAQQALGLTDAQLDALWTSAAQIT